MNTFVIQVFFLIVLFMVICLHFKNLKDYFNNKLIEKEDDINILYSVLKTNKNSDTKIALSSIVDKNKNIILRWYSKEFEEVKDMRNIFTIDNNTEFYIAIVFKDINQLEKSYHFILFNKFKNLKKQKLFYTTVLDLNTDIFVKNKYDLFDVYILSKNNEERNYNISNKISLNKKELISDGSINIVVEEPKVEKGKMIISCNPDGTYEEGITQSFREFPELNDIQNIREETENMLKKLEEKPNKKTIIIDENLFSN